VKGAEFYQIPTLYRAVPVLDKVIP